MAGSAMVPVDERRRLLEERIEHAKERLLADIRYAGGLVRQVGAKARHGLVRAALVTGGLVIFGVAMAFLGRRRRRRIRVTWR